MHHLIKIAQTRSFPFLPPSPYPLPAIHQFRVWHLAFLRKGLGGGKGGRRETGNILSAPQKGATGKGDGVGMKEARAWPPKNGACARGPSPSNFWGRLFQMLMMRRLLACLLVRSLPWRRRRNGGGGSFAICPAFLRNPLPHPSPPIPPTPCTAFFVLRSLERFAFLQWSRLALRALATSLR